MTTIVRVWPSTVTPSDRSFSYHIFHGVEEDPADVFVSPCSEKNELGHACENCCCLDHHSAGDCLPHLLVLVSFPRVLPPKNRLHVGCAQGRPSLSTGASLGGLVRLMPDATDQCGNQRTMLWYRSVGGDLQGGAGGAFVTFPSFQKGGRAVPTPPCRVHCG